MTDLLDSSGASDRDELASAYLDGEAAPAEFERVEADVDLLRRVEVLGAVRERLAVDSPAPEAVEAHIAAALAAFGEPPQAATASSVAEDAPVSDLAARRRSWSQRLPMGAVAAAAVIVALVAGVAAFTARDTDSTDMATGTSDDAVVDAGGSTILGGDLGGGDGSVTADSGGAEFAPSSTELRQVFADDDALAQYVRSQLDGSAPRPAGEASGGAGAPVDDGDLGAAERVADPCDAVGVAGVDRPQVRLVVPIVLGGDDATAVAYTDADGVDHLVVVRDATCEISLRRPL